MAYISNTAFEARITNNRNDDLANITGKYYNSSTAEDCSAGFLCNTGDQLDAEGMPSGTVNENAYKMAAASAGTGVDVIYACNSYDWPLLSDARSGNLWAVGKDTLGLPVPANRYGTFTAIIFDGKHHYRFGVGNLTTTLSTNKYLTVSSGKLAPGASAPAAGTRYFKVIGTGNFTEGNQASFGYVDVVAMPAALS